MRDVFNVPRRYKGETTILKLFKPKSLVYTVIGTLIGIVIFNVLSLFGYVISGTIISLLIILAFYGFGSFKLPIDQINSGGEDIDLIIYRFLKKRKKVIYRYGNRQEQ